MTTQHSRAAVVERGAKESLSRLGLSYLDLYLMHWPIALINGTFDHAPHTIQDTWSAMEKLQGKGLVRAIGVSNFGIKKLEELLKSAKIRPAVNQIEAHPYLPQWELIDFCKHHKILVTAYSPLGSPGRDHKSQGEPHLISDPAVLLAAEESTCTPAQALIRWALMRGTAVIPKSVTPERIRENLLSVNGTLTSSSWRGINEVAVMGKSYRYITGQKFWGSKETSQSFWS